MHYTLVQRIPYLQTWISSLGHPEQAKGQRLPSNVTLIRAPRSPTGKSLHIRGPQGSEAPGARVGRSRRERGRTSREGRLRLRRGKTKMRHNGGRMTWSSRSSRQKREWGGETASLSRGSGPSTADERHELPAQESQRIVGGINQSHLQARAKSETGVSVTRGGRGSFKGLSPSPAARVTAAHLSCVRRKHISTCNVLLQINHPPRAKAKYKNFAQTEPAVHRPSLKEAQASGEGN